MKFIFFYSDIYEYYNKHIHANLNSVFQLEAIKIDDIRPKHGHTFAGGVSIKIELIVQKIKENMGDSIIFTDATIFINSNKTNELPDFFNKYLDNDLCFPRQMHDDVNIGIILIKCNTNTLTFFENVLTELISNGGWDQQIVNEHLKINNNLKINTFDPPVICCGHNFHTPFKDTYLIFKSFISHNGNANDMFNQRMNTFKKYGLITEEEYNANYKNSF